MSRANVETEVALPWSAPGWFPFPNEAGKDKWQYSQMRKGLTSPAARSGSSSVALDRYDILDPNEKVYFLVIACKSLNLGSHL